MVINFLSFNLTILIFGWWLFYVQYYMKKFVDYIVNMMSEQNLFAPQGGPIILAQVDGKISSSF